MEITRLRLTAPYTFTYGNAEILVPAGQMVKVAGPEHASYVRCYLNVQAGRRTFEAYADVDQAHLADV